MSGRTVCTKLATLSCYGTIAFMEYHFTNTESQADTVQNAAAIAGQLALSLPRLWQTEMVLKIPND